MPKNKLIPCRCCGTARFVEIYRIRGDVKGYVAECSLCQKQTCLCYSEESAIDHWNKIADRRY